MRGVARVALAEDVNAAREGEIDEPPVPDRDLESGGALDQRGGRPARWGLPRRRERLVQERGPRGQAGVQAHGAEVPNVAAVQHRRQLVGRRGEKLIREAAAAALEAHGQRGVAGHALDTRERPRARVGPSPQAAARVDARNRTPRRLSLAATLAHESRVRDAREGALVDDHALVRRQGHGALDEIVAAAPAHEVPARGQRQPALGRAARRLSDDLAVGAAGKDQVAARRGQRQHAQRTAAARREAREGDVAVTTQVVGERRVLRAAEAATGRAQRPLVGVRVGLVQGDALIAVGVGGAAQARHEKMREERAAQVVGLLRHLVRGARRQEHCPFVLAGCSYLDVEGRRRCASLDVRQRTRAARVYDQHARLRGRAAHQGLELVDGKLRTVEVQRVRVGMARVIDEQQRVAARVRAQPLVEANQCAPRRGRRLRAQHGHVLGVEVAEIAKQARDLVGVLLRVAQAHLVRLARVLPDDQCDAGARLGACARGRHDQRQDDRQDAVQGRTSYVRRST